MRLYVGNLPYSCSEQDLKDLFAEFNPSSVKLIIDRETGRSKGFGFVEIDSREDSLKAIEELDKKNVEGKTLVVNEARPPQKREDRGGGGFRDDRGGRGGFRGEGRDDRGGRSFNKTSRGGGFGRG